MFWFTQQQELVAGDGFTERDHPGLSPRCIWMHVLYREREFCSLNINQLSSLTELWRSWSSHLDFGCSDSQGLSLKTMWQRLDHE